MNIIKNFLKPKRITRTICYIDFIRDIHPDDEMYLFIKNHPAKIKKPEKVYYDSGVSMIGKLLDITADMKVDLKNVNNFLEFACGYGRFTRFLLMELDHTKITVSDIYKDAVNFQKKIFKVKGFYSTQKPKDLKIPEKYEVIFVASLFSHLPENTWKLWLKKLYNSLNDGGLLIFSTHGIKCMTDRNNMPDNGFCYMKMSESSTLSLNAYGTTYVLKDYVDNALKQIAGKKADKFYEQYLWNYQDVYVIRKD